MSDSISKFHIQDAKNGILAPVYSMWITMQVFVGNPLEEESATAQKYIDDVIKRLLFLKKLDGYPVIRDMDNDEDEEVNSLLDMEEIEKMAKYVLWKYCAMCMTFPYFFIFFLNF